MWKRMWKFCNFNLMLWEYKIYKNIIKLRQWYILHFKSYFSSWYWACNVNRFGMCFFGRIKTNLMDLYCDCDCCIPTYGPPCIMQKLNRSSTSSSFVFLFLLISFQWPIVFGEHSSWLLSLNLFSITAMSWWNLSPCSSETAPKFSWKYGKC